MATVSDIMTKDVFCLDEDAPIGSASWEMNAEFVSGAPVRNRQGKVVGILSKTDLVGPDSKQPARVKDLMTEGITSIGPEAKVADVVEVMLNRGIHRVLVVDSDDKLVGIVTPLDVLRQLDRTGQLESV